MGQERAQSPSRELQHNGIVSLLGVLEEGEGTDDSAPATFDSGSGSGSEGSLAANASTTPALVLPSVDSIPSFALDSPEAQDLPQPVSRKVEDILELLSASPSAASRLSIESVVQRDVAMCAYAL